MLYLHHPGQYIEGIDHLCHCSRLCSANRFVFLKKSAGWLVAGFGICAAQQSLAQGLCVPPQDEVPAETFLPFAPIELEGEQLEIVFGRAELSGTDNAEFSENVELRFRDKRFATESASYDRARNSVDFEGRVTYSDSTVVVFAEGATLDATDGSVVLGESGFELPQRPARGSASSIAVDDAEQLISLTDVEFTTCPIEQMAWQIEASDIDLDVDEGFGSARGMRLRFKGVPLLYAPYFTFPINDERKSGFLTPDFAERDRTGLYIAVPYYFNLAPNYDLVLEPRYLSKRGVQLSNQFRYLLERSEGSFEFEYLPDDSDADRTRSYVNLQHETAFGESWLLTAGLEEVSDAAYFDDLGNSLSVTSQTHLNRFVDINYYAPNWSLLSRFQNYQTIDPFIEDSDRPYERVPQVLFEGDWRGNLVGFDSSAELVNFDRNIGTTGWRFDSTQEVSFNFARPGMYLTPAVAWRQTNYWLDDTAPGEDESLTRSLPIASIDAGMLFERSGRNGSRFFQTLEPRILYVNVPFEDQSALPVFDTIMPDFNLIQLFRKYQFVGPDRISDTDQLSFGVTTRLIASSSGRERLTATLGQTRYLTPQRVSLPGEAPNESSASDYVAEVSMSLSESWGLDVGYQWNSETDSTARAETRFEFRPQDDRIFGFGYRYRRGLLEQGDLSLVWPVSQRWRFIGRYSYSLLENEPLEQFLGWEYDACCWRLRMIGRQYVSRRTGETDSAFSIQLELKGLSRSARSPEEFLDRGILGYRPMPGSSM